MSIDQYSLKHDVFAVIAIDMRKHLSKGQSVRNGDAGTIPSRDCAHRKRLRVSWRDRKHAIDAKLALRRVFSGEWG